MIFMNFPQNYLKKNYLKQVFRLSGTICLRGPEVVISEQGTNQTAYLLHEPARN
jgi:hypothetical protein